MQNNKFSVAVLGAGNIGSAVIKRLQEIDDKVLRLEVKKVLVRDVSKERDVDKDVLTANFKEILDDDSIDLVIEVIGGIEPGKEYIKSLLRRGKAVITANKDIIADCGPELISLSRENNTCLYYEAAVAAGIPVLKPLIELLEANPAFKSSLVSISDSVKTSSVFLTEFLLKVSIPDEVAPNKRPLIRPPLKLT